MRAFAAETALLDAAEGGGRIGYETTVEADHAAFQPLRDPQSASEVAGVDIGDQSVFRIVRRGDRLLLGFEGGDRGDR